ncbi:MAG: hypothetical protein NVS9B10_19570 [Nevskia sp.]
MNKKLTVAAGLAFLALVPTVAMAHTDVTFGINLGGGYYEPAPVYVAPPPPAYYYGYEAPVRYYSPEVRYGYYGHDRDDWGRYHRDHGRHHGHHDNDDDDDDD